MSNNRNLSGIWRNNNITQRNYLVIGMMLLLMYIFIFHIFSPLGEKYSFVKNLDRVCLCEHDSDTIRSITRRSRGATYYITGDEDEKNNTVGLDNCATTVWEGSHLLMHILIGYLLDVRWSLAIGTPFEIWEWYQYGCENILDVAYNTMGATIGGLLRIYTS